MRSLLPVDLLVAPRERRGGHPERAPDLPPGGRVDLAAALEDLGRVHGQAGGGELGGERARRVETGREVGAEAEELGGELGVGHGRLRRIGTGAESG